MGAWGTKVETAPYERRDKAMRHASHPLGNGASYVNGTDRELGIQLRVTFVCGVRTCIGCIMRSCRAARTGKHCYTLLRQSLNVFKWLVAAAPMPWRASSGPSGPEP